MPLPTNTFPGGGEPAGGLGQQRGFYPPCVCRCHGRPCAAGGLISTDKAVRPTNVMGASKRLAELVVQAHAAEATSTRCPWWLGNVLGSSGSVCLCFVDKLQKVGQLPSPTRKYRYFMTIPEAATLVLQASVLAQGGDVFLLDMGEPVRIKALAEQMVRMSGLSLRDSAHPDGDIEIVCIGLRPGEKLYEECLSRLHLSPQRIR